MQLFRPGAGRARLFFRLHRRRASMAIFFAPFIAPAPCRDLVAKTRHELSRSPTLHRILIHWPSYPGSTLMARDRTMTEVKSEIVLSIIISILARCVRGTASGAESRRRIVSKIKIVEEQWPPVWRQVLRCRRLRKGPIRPYAQLARPTVGAAAIDVPIQQRKGHNVDHPYGKG